MPPALPRPPTCTWALMTTGNWPIRSAAATASSTVSTASPFDTGMPNEAKNCLPWYSNRSIPADASRARRGGPAVRIGWERADPSGDTRHPLLARPKPGRGARPRSRVPIERRTARMQTTTLVISVVALARGAAPRASSSSASATGSNNSKMKINLGTDIFRPATPSERAAAIAKDGPLLFSDVSGGGQDRPIFVNHLGHDPKTGWVRTRRGAARRPRRVLPRVGRLGQAVPGGEGVRGGHLSRRRHRASPATRRP